MTVTTWYYVAGWPWGCGVHERKVQRETPGFLYVVERRTSFDGTPTERVRRVKKANHFPTFEQAKAADVQRSARRVEAAKRSLEEAKEELREAKARKRP